MIQQYGGSWTEKKLDCVQKYLRAYTTIMSKQRFRFAYIDAFAGTGYRELEDEETHQILIPELIEEETESFLKGSVQRALQITPHFHKYLLVEKNKKKCKELKRTIKSYPDIKDRIEIINRDANEYLSDICRLDWSGHRAVLFLDPFGMQVKWSTIESIAKTKAIDMWLLFPLGIGVSRLLKKNGQIKNSLKSKLDDVFGTQDWFNEFYRVTIEDTLFGSENKIKKDVDFEKIAKYFTTRLKMIFNRVSEIPAKLDNSKNVPLFLLCFAAGNPIGATTAVKIANHLLKGIK
jgi:three-Cys-motif partner protein